MNLPLQPPKSTARKPLWIGLIILAVTLLIMVAALLRFKTQLKEAPRLAAPATAASAPAAVAPVANGK